MNLSAYYLSIPTRTVWLACMTLLLGFLLFYLRFLRATPAKLQKSVLLHISVISSACIWGSGLVRLTDVDGGTGLSVLLVPAILTVLFVLIQPEFMPSAAGAALQLVMLIGTVWLMLCDPQPDLPETIRFLLYAMIRLVGALGAAGLLSDMMLAAFLRFKGHSREADPKAERLLLHAMGNLLAFTLAMLLFVIPSDLYYVNTAGYGYCAVMDAGLTKLFGAKIPQNDSSLQPDGSSAADSGPEPEEPVQIARTQPLTLDAALLQDTARIPQLEFDSETLLRQSHLTWDHHAFTSPVLMIRAYDNPILNTAVTITEKYRVNPTYLFRYLLQLKGEPMTLQAPEVPQPARTETISRDGVKTKDYMAALVRAVVSHCPSIPQDTALSVAADEGGVYYTYFTICDAEAVSCITLYLADKDDSTALDRVEYSVVQLADLPESTRSLRLPNYEAELSAAFAAVLDGQMSEQVMSGAMLKDHGSRAFYRTASGKYTVTN